MAKIQINPLLAKEVRVKMRSWRIFGMVSAYLLALGGLGMIFFATQSHMLRVGYTDLAGVGQSLFGFLAVVQLILLYFLVPGMTASVISNERERQTLDLLVCTQLTPFGIVRGKLTAALSTVVLLILATLPLYGFVFFLGGVAPGELYKLVAVFLFVAFVYGSYSLLLSSLFRRTIAAVVSSYAVALFMLAGTLIVSGMVHAIFFARNLESPVYLLLLFNPLMLLEVLFPDIVGSLVEEFSHGAYPYAWDWLKFWHIAALVNGGLAALCLRLATRVVNPLLGKRRAG